MPTATAARPISDKQRDLIMRLHDELGQPVAIDLDTLTGGKDGSASRYISGLFAVKAQAGGGAKSGTTKVDPKPGLYKVDDDMIVRIRMSKSGNWYAQQAMKRPNRATITWDYLGKRINMSRAVPVDDAEAGKFLGYCVRCCAELTKPESIARGMGPVCAKKGA